MTSISESTSNEQFIINVTDHNTTLDDADDDAFTPPSPPRRGKALNYEIVIKFSTMKEAKHWIADSHESWKNIKCSNDTIYYKCRKCTMRLKLICNQYNTSVTIWTTEGSHNHSLATRGIEPEIKKEIDRLYDSGVTLPNQILNQLDKKGMTVVKSKLTNFLVRLKAKKISNHTICLSDLISWCKDNREVPDCDDKVFVANSELKYDEENSTMRIFFTTKRLVRLAQQNNTHICADATYKLIWQGYPVMIIGTTDHTKKFHPLGLALCMHETRADFAFIFTSLRDIVRTVCNIDYQPSILIANDSVAIKNGFTETFDHLSHRVMCYSRVVRNVNKNLKLLKNHHSRCKIKKDIEHIQKSENKVAFKEAIKMFSIKWSDESAFIDYFQKEWVDKLDGWYEGYAPGMPSTNNGLKAFHLEVKSEHMFGYRSPAGQFVELVKQNIVHGWSLIRDPVNINSKAHVKARGLPNKTLIRH